MAIYEVTQTGLQKVSSSTMTDAGVKERADIQQWIRKDPSVLGERLLIIAEEFCSWEDSKRRIDLLALDEDGNAVVIELKRSDDGGHMELQAIRYAAMISALRYEDVVRHFDDYLAKNDPAAKGQADARIRDFLDKDPGDQILISDVPRIVLLSGDFSLEITTTVLWLINRGIDIRCIQCTPYKVDSKLLLDLSQVIPLEQAADYQVRLRQKQEVARKTAGARREETLKMLARHGLLKEGMEIEVVPKALPADGKPRDAKLFRARIADPMSRKASVVWCMNEKQYSLTQLTIALWDKHDMEWLANNITIHWRVVGQSESLWDLAEGLIVRE